MSTSVYQVPDISCGHCKQSIEAEVGSVAGVRSVEVDVDRRTVTVDTAGDEAQVEAAIGRAGYEIAGD